MEEKEIIQNKVLEVANLFHVIGMWKERFSDDSLAGGFFDVESIRTGFPGLLEDITLYLKEKNVDLDDQDCFTIEEAQNIRKAIQAIAEAKYNFQLIDACKNCSRISYGLDEKILQIGVERRKQKI